MSVLLKLTNVRGRSAISAVNCNTRSESHSACGPIISFIHVVWSECFLPTTSPAANRRDPIGHQRVRRAADHLQDEMPNDDRPDRPQPPLNGKENEEIAPRVENRREITDQISLRLRN